MDDNELFGKLGAVNLVVTLDSGANTSLVPEELVDPVCFTGNTTMVRTAIRYNWENMEDKWFEAREALVTFAIAGLTLDRTVYCIPGADYCSSHEIHRR